jgi:hypothetical protein
LRPTDDARPCAAAGDPTAGSAASAPPTRSAEDRPNRGDLAIGCREAFRMLRGVVPPSVGLRACGLDHAPGVASIDQAALGRLITVLLARAVGGLEGPAMVTVDLDEAMVDDAAALRLGVAPGAYAVVRLADPGHADAGDPGMREITGILGRHGGALALEPNGRDLRLSCYLPVAGH